MRARPLTRWLTLTVLVAFAAMTAAPAGATTVPTCPTAASEVCGPDVASYQHPSGAPIDWSAVAAGGSSFAFVKATEGTTYANPYFAPDWSGLATAGLVRGAYHYAWPSSTVGSAAAQARYFVDTAGSLVTLGDLPPVLDLEQSGGLAPADLVAWTQQYLTAVQTLTGRTPILYTNPSFWLNDMADSTHFGQYPLWLASYSSTPPAPLPGWTAWTFWQYTSSGSIPGITGNVDISQFAGTLDQLKGLANPGVARLGGTDRYATAIKVSHAAYPAGTAQSAVLARGDLYPDALVGAPLARAKSGPLLLTPADSLDPRVAAELTRVLGPQSGKTVYLLGGSGALSPAVQSAVANLGFRPVRLDGKDRFGTAAAVAHALGDPDTVYLATGTNFPDALVAGDAAASHDGSVLLTDGSVMPPGLSSYLTGRTVKTIGGPAHAAFPSAPSYVGRDRYQTSTLVAAGEFAGSSAGTTGPGSVGVATGTNFPDALAGSPFLAAVGSGLAPLVLTTPTALPAVVSSYLGSLAAGTPAYVFGSTGAVATAVSTAVAKILHLPPPTT
jgi:lysozyme